MEILALDASTKSTGWAIFKDSQLINYGCITNNSSDLYERIKFMVREIEKILNSNTNIQKIILEEVPFEEKGQNIKTHKALMYLQAGIAFLVHDKFSFLSIETIFPNSWRKDCGIKTGTGIKRGELKTADMNFVMDNFGIVVNDDIADAVGIGYSYIQKESAW